MSILNESLGQSAQGAGLGAGLRAAVGTLSAEEQFLFTLYKRLILPADGFVFFAPASTITPPITGVEFAFTTNGSLHVAQETQQEVDANYARQSVRFTSPVQVEQFEAIENGYLYVMTLPNGSLLAFNGQTGRYDQAGIWHYAGRALFPFEASQVIQTAADLPMDKVVSNSLPFWLGLSTDEIPVFPSFLVPQNQVPPYVAADIRFTQPIGAAPLYDATNGQSQLTQELVRFTLYGLGNDDALDFQRAVLDNSSAPGRESYGIMSMPAPVDEKRPQSEFGIIAQQKTMDVEINYLQVRSRAESRKLILSAFIEVTPA